MKNAHKRFMSNYIEFIKFKYISVSFDFKNDKCSKID